MKKKIPTDLIEVPEWKGKLFLGPDHTYWWMKKEPHPLSGVTSILNVISKPALIPWAVKMAIEYLREITIDIELGYTRDQWNQWLDEAKVEHKNEAERAANLGKEAHAKLEAYIKECISLNAGVPVPLIDADPRVLEFSEWAVKRNQETGFTFIASEMPLADPKLAIAGTPDVIAEERDALVICDLKTGSGIYDRTPFFQMAAYAHMWMRWKRKKQNVRLVIIHAPAQRQQPLTEYWSEDWKGDWASFKAALLIHRTKGNFTQLKK